LFSWPLLHRSTSTSHLCNSSGNNFSFLCISILKFFFLGFLNV
jgi:hypothetical protein